MQLKLARRGYYKGPIDGIIGSGTRWAIRRFQYDSKLPVTGWIDGNLLRKLDLV
ncbi:MAG: peptidoglycan-binding protein [Verrucomicrobiota bacterium]|nr:peptidoglycan-binding protein [Verrucomicrobiota bacterium]